VNRLISENNGRKQSAIAWLIHHYLFFRIPLIRPQVLLAKILPYLRWLFSPVTAFCVLGITLTGLFLVARQWETFSTTFIDQLTIAGFLSYGAALLFSKCLHEFGHAITATRYGVRVGHMGVALLVMLPLPYTDTSESWKLSDNKQRLHIAAAGIITELALAGIATLAWSLADNGPLKSALFYYVRFIRFSQLTRARRRDGQNLVKAHCAWRAGCLARRFQTQKTSFADYIFMYHLAISHDGIFGHRMVGVLPIF
jgi:putative peptide zinc metalloprotease protein